MYGQTEATARLTYLPPERIADKLGSVGIAIPGVELEVRGEDGPAAPPGASGSVGARRQCDARLLARQRGHVPPRRTDGCAPEMSAGWIEEGFLFLEGRRSDIIKVGAHRVNPLDIELAIASLTVSKKSPWSASTMPYWAR